MRLRLITLSVVLVAGCVPEPSTAPAPSTAAAPSTDVAPPDGSGLAAGPAPAVLVGDRSWSSYDGGYLFGVGFFTLAEERDPAWEKARLDARHMASFCEEKELVRREVRWVLPATPGEPVCAKIVYAFSCKSKRPQGGNSLEYQMQEQLLKEPMLPIGPHCGEKDHDKVMNDPDRKASIRDPEPSDIQLLKGGVSCRDMPADETRGQIGLQDVNHIRTRVLVAPNLIRRTRIGFDDDPVRVIRIAAYREQKRHFVVTKGELAPDGTNIFVDQTYTDNRDGYCLTLTARQGGALWRRTIVRESAPEVDHRERVGRRSKDPEHYWDTETDAELLQREFALYLGMKLPDDSPD